MAVPILEIPINDKDFKDFVATFKKYQTELAAQPQMWSGVNSSILDAVNSATSFAESLDHELSTMEKIGRVEEDRDRKQQDARRRKKKDNEEDNRHEEQASTRRRRALDQVREYSRNIGNVVKKGGAWAGGVAEGAISGVSSGSAGGLFGAAGGILKGIPLIGGMLGGLATAGFEVMSNLNGARQQAHGVGVNVQTLQGWKNALGPYLPQGSAESLLGTVSEAQASPGGGGLFGRFGIKNYNNRGVSDLSAEMLTKAQGYLKGHPGAQGLWGAKSLYGGALDTGTLRTLQQMSPKELQDSLAKMRKFVDDNSNAEEAALKATNDLSAAELTATSLMNKFGNGMTSALDQVTGSLHELFDAIQPYLGTAKKWAQIGHDVTTPGGLFSGIHSDSKGGHDVVGHAVDNAYNTVVANIKSVVPITQMAIKDLLVYGRSTLIPQTKAMGIGRDSRGLIGSSATGAYQITGETIKGHSAFLASKFGSNWQSHNFDATMQETLAEQIFKERKGGDLASTWKSLKDHRPGAYAGMSWEQVRGMIAQGESGGLPHSDTGHVARAVAHAVKKGVEAAHRSTKTHKSVTIKTQSKPGSDVTVSARQMAGR